MPDYEDELRKRTFKDQTDTLQQRVYYTLHDGMPKSGTPTDRQLELWIHKTSKLLSSVVEALVDKGVITPDQLDEFLFAATR